MEWLEYRFWGNSALRWLIAVGIVVATVGILYAVRAITCRRLRRGTVDAPGRLRNIFAEALNATHVVFYLVIAVYAASRELVVPRHIDAGLRVAAILAALFQVGLWVQHVIGATVSVYRARRADEAAGTIAAAFGFLARVLAWSIIFILVLSNLGVEVSALVAGLGIGGIAAALAVQNSLGDLFASLSLYFDRPFDLGDFIIVDSFMGTVERIGVRSTRIESLGGEQIVFANSDLANARIRNYRRMNERRAVFHIGVTYQTDADDLERIPTWVKEVIDRGEKRRFDRCHFKRFGDFSLEFEIVYYVLSRDYTEYMKEQHDINLALFRKLQEEGVSFAYPTRTVYYRPADRDEDREREAA